MKKKEIEGGEKKRERSRNVSFLVILNGARGDINGDAGSVANRYACLIKAETVARLTIHERGRGGTT